MDDARERAATKLLTAQELSAASRLSLSTIHRLKRQGRLPFLQPAGKGGKLLFPADAIERAAMAVLEETARAEAANRGKETRLSGPRPAWMQSPSPQPKVPENAP